MSENNAGITTLSVRQLANLVGRSEQTVRRWHDQGKLVAGLPADAEDAARQEAESPGGLVFTIDAVREFVQKNPRILDRAKPELVSLLNGEQIYPAVSDSAAQSKSSGAQKGAAALAAASVLTSGLGTVAIPVVAGATALVLAGKFLGGKSKKGAEEADNGDDDRYLHQLLLAREAEVNRQLKELELELEHIEKEHARSAQRSEYAGNLLLARALEVNGNMEGLQRELEQIQAEKDALEGR